MMWFWCSKFIRSGERMPRAQAENGNLSRCQLLCYGLGKYEKERMENRIDKKCELNVWSPLAFAFAQADDIRDQVNAQ